MVTQLQPEAAQLLEVEQLRAANAKLQAQNAALTNDITSLEKQLAALRAELCGVNSQNARGDIGSSEDGCGNNGCSEPASAPASTSPQPQPPQPPRAAPSHGLSREQVERYSRHLLLPAFGVAAQERVCRGSVLVVGCGGLGSPVAMYLAAAGVGRLGLVDHDTVDVTNLHRQVMHTTGRVGMPKALSGRLTCTAINPTIRVEAHACGFRPDNALALVERYDVVVDASDNPATRYLVSDACVVAGRPLVSAAAVGTDGQLTVYNYGQDGPCYRCLFPESPAPENCSRCGEAGVLGVVPGIMGCLQALEAIKILAGVGDVSSKKLTIFDALAGRFTAVKLRGRSPSCRACGPSPAITRQSLPSYDYVMFTGQPPDDGPPEEVRLLDASERWAPADVAAAIAAGRVVSAPAPASTNGTVEQQGTGRQQQQQREEEQGEEAEGDGAGLGPGGRGNGGQRVVLLDVRPKAQYDIVALPGVVHVPFEEVERRLEEVLALCGAGGGGGGSGGGAAATVAAAGCGTCGLQGPGPGSEEQVQAAGTGACSGAAAAEGAGVGAGGEAAGGGGGSGPQVVVLCRRGNNSQRVAARLRALGVGGVTDMRGGYQAWAREVDPGVPLV